MIFSECHSAFRLRHLLVGEETMKTFAVCLVKLVVKPATPVKPDPLSERIVSGIPLTATTWLIKASMVVLAPVSSGTGIAVHQWVNKFSKF